VLNTELTPELTREGFSRDLVRFVNDQRKEMNCAYNDRIRLGIVTQSPELRLALEDNEAYIRGETLAEAILTGPIDGVPAIPFQVSDHEADLYIARCRAVADGAHGG